LIVTYCRIGYTYHLFQSCMDSSYVSYQHHDNCFIKVLCFEALVSCILLFSCCRDIWEITKCEPVYLDLHGFLLIIIGYTTYRHVSIGLIDQDAAHYVMNPFFNDHTSYGAILAMLIPVCSRICDSPQTVNLVQDGFISCSFCSDYRSDIILFTCCMG